MYTQKRTREEAPAVQQVPKMTTREHPVSSATSLRKALSIQNLAQIETPWEGVTLNRCLIIAISILVLTSGLQRINEALRGHKDEEITAVSERHAVIRRAKLPTHEPETSLWDTFFWWVDDDDEGSSKRKSKRASQKRTSRGFRHRTVPNLRLLKKRETKFTERRGRRDAGEMKERTKRTKEKEIEVRKKKIEKEEEEEEEEMMEISKKKPVKDSKQKTN